MEKDNRKHWYGPLYLLEGFTFAVGVQNKSFFLTTASFIGAIATTLSDLNSRRLDIKDAKREIKEKMENQYAGD